MSHSNCSSVSYEPDMYVVRTVLRVLTTFVAAKICEKAGKLKETTKKT